MYDIFMSLDLKTMLHDEFHGAEEEIPRRHVKVLSLYLLKESEDCRHQFVSKKYLRLTLSRFPWFQIFQVRNKDKETRADEGIGGRVICSIEVFYGAFHSLRSHFTSSIDNFTILREFARCCAGN